MFKKKILFLGLLLVGFLFVQERALAAITWTGITPPAGDTSVNGSCVSASNPSKQKYVGNFRNQTLSETGIYYCENGDTLQGQFNDQLFGPGSNITPGGTRTSITTPVIIDAACGPAQVEPDLVCSITSGPTASAENPTDHWICVLHYDKPQMDPFTNTMETDSCTNLKEQRNVQTETEAKKVCYSYCDPTQVTNGTPATSCVFINSLTCSDYAGLSSAKKGAYSVPFELPTGVGAALNHLQAGSLSGLIGLIIRGALGIIGTIALLIFIYGGVLWMTARGNSSQIEKAMQTILWGGLGVVVMLSSYAIVDYIFKAFQ